MSDIDDIEEEGPMEDDLHTSDHETFYQHGRVAFKVLRDATTAQMWRAIDRWMASQKFYPNVWFISDHGNAYIMTQPKKTTRKRR